ncbi:hypothetical protein [Chloroflexus aggregans]|uniref:hypothetical protein n=1 Tax=Chloroflexus aggregans TaxID=152260 RepID=UPI00059C0904|nr:hypothetical protein [Chloroflexus aggregans]
MRPPFLLARALVRSLEETLRHLEAIATERSAAIQESPSAELWNLLNDGLIWVRRLTIILMEGSVITAWMSLMKAWEEQRPSLADWAAAPRLRLNRERLAELDTARAQQADLLPRLDCRFPGRLTVEERERARQILSGWLPTAGTPRCLPPPSTTPRSCWPRWATSPRRPYRSSAPAWSTRPT